MQNGILFILIRWLVLILSFCGYFLFFSRKMDPAFVPGFTFSAIGALLLFFGMVKLLALGAIAIALGGLICLFIFWQKKWTARCFLNYGSAFFLLLSLAFVLILRNSLMVNYDNFSHWGLVVRIMLNNHRLPNVSDSLVRFQSYPLGSSCFLYYISAITGSKAEWVQLWSQALLMSGMLLSLFAFSRKIVSCFVVSAVIFIFLCSNISFCDLSVDTLLPAVAVSASSFCVYYRSCLTEKKWFLLPWLVFLTAIKNSGILFAFFVILFFFLFLRHSQSGKKAFGESCKLLLFLIAELLLWGVHVVLNYPHGFSTKHSISPNNLYAGFRHKSSKDLIEIILKIVRKLFSFHNSFFYLLIFILAFIVFLRIRKKRPNPETAILFKVSLAAYFLFSLGIVAMYLTSMPLKEAISLSGFMRYYSSIHQYIAGLLLIAAVIECDSLSPEKTFSVFSSLIYCILLISLVFCLKPIFRYYLHQDLSGTARERMETIRTEFSIPLKQTYLLLNDPEVNGFANDYLEYMARYTFLSDHCTVVSDLSDEKDLEPLTFDYIIVFEETEKNVDDVLSICGIYQRVVPIQAGN